MKTNSSKKNEAVNTSTTKPFFQKNGNYFSSEPTHQSSFFSKPTIQPKLSIGQPNDSLEQEADAVADSVMQSPNSKIKQEANSKVKQQSAPVQPQIMKSGKKGDTSASPTLTNQLAQSKGTGTSLSADSNSMMSKKIGYDFSKVKVHTGNQANQMNQSLNAKAFTHGSDIYFNKGQYNPNSFAGQHLLAHELTHVVQQSDGHQKIQRQAAAAPPATAPTPAPRQDVVYIMGTDNGDFFEGATRFYRARFPNATFVNDVDIRNLRNILTHLTTTFTEPLGNIIIVSHANEDGRLSSLQLDSADTTPGMDVTELRDALNPDSGSSSLPTVTTQVDDQTRIKIKGCDLGRNREIVELIDQAFNGQGTVSAPTHEQNYNFDLDEIEQGTSQAMNEHIAEFEQNLPELPPIPSPLNPQLQGDERDTALEKIREARRIRQVAVENRAAAIEAERTRYTPTAAMQGEIAGTYEFMTGPMFQHTGTALFTAGDLRPEVDTLYDHLSDTQREEMVDALIALDPRTPEEALRDGVINQQGQRLYRFEQSISLDVPQNLAQAEIALAEFFAENNFEPTSISISRNTSDEETILTYEITGTINGVETIIDHESDPIPSDQSLIDEIKATVNNPDKFAWRVEENQNSNGQLVKTVIRERVLAYLHHGNLNAAPGDYFLPPETDRDFFVESTSTPPLSGS
ncbi:MAG: DUF4157 domain-containing protein [Saprospiraceae bacterium]